MFSSNLFEKLDFRYGRSINIAYANSPSSFPLHWHTHIEIIAPLHNNYKITVNSLHYLLQKDDIALIMPGELHSIDANETHGTFVLQFSPTLLTILCEFSRNFYIFNQVHVITREKFPQLAKELLAILLNMNQTYASNITFKEGLLYSDLLQFFSILGTHCMADSDRFSDISSTQQKKYIEKFAEVCTYITDNCTEELTLDSVAQYAGFSKFHFSRMFKQFTDISFQDFVTLQKTKKAEVLLSNPTLSITDIAFQSGFCSLSTFNRVFKKYKNCTPREFRALCSTPPN